MRHVFRRPLLAPMESGLAVLLLSCCALGLAISLPGQTGVGNVVVRVTREGMEPVAQAEVRVAVFGRGAFVERAWTDDTGRVFFRGISVGAYVVEVTKSGYEPARQPLDLVSPGTTNEVFFSLRLSQPTVAPEAPGRAVSAGALAAPPEARKLVKQGIAQLKTHTAESMASFQRAIELHPRYAEAYAWLGLAHLREKQNLAAMEALTRALELEPRLGLARALRGRLFLEEKDLRRAEDDLVEAVRIEPEAWDAHYDLARCYLQSGRNELALAHARRAHDLPSAPAATHLLLFDIHLKLNDRPNAQRELEEFTRAEPQSALLPRMKKKIAQLRSQP